MAEIVIGIDGGGTYTRVIAANLSGRVLATVKADAASPHKSAQAEQNVRDAIREAVSRAGHTLEDVVQLAAGIAGLDSPEDQAWAEGFTNLPGLRCPRLHVNDAVVARAGALLSQPGIIVIAGTGSIVFGVTEAERAVRNYDFYHYARSSARYLAYDAMYQVLAGNVEAEDEMFVADILAFWQAKDVPELREQGLQGFVADPFERGRRFGAMAPLVTEAAQKGTPLAQTVCNAAAAAVGAGVRLVGSCFASDSVSVALIGGVAQSVYMRQSIGAALAKSADKRYQIVESALSSEAGAVLMALARHGVTIDDTVIAALKANS